MSQFRVEKRRAHAELTLATGEMVRGSFFLASSTPTQVGPERIADLLNAAKGFFPFDPAGDADSGTILVNRAHVVAVRLLEPSAEARDDAGYELATERRVAMTLVTGARLEGSVRVYCPQGRDRLSDWARSADAFRYLETADTTFIVNTAHIVDVRETAQAEQVAHAGRAGWVGRVVGKSEENNA
jgi:hypothetical protein